MGLKWWEAEHEAQQNLSSTSKDMWMWSQLTEERKKNGFEVKVQFGVRESYIPPTDSPPQPSCACELFSDGTLKDAFFSIPSIPGRPMFHSASHDYVVIKWEKPERGRINLVYYEILILQDEKNQKKDQKLWISKKEESPKKEDLIMEQGLYGVKKRYYLPPRKDDSFKDFLSSRITDLPADVNIFFQVSSFSRYGRTAKSEISFLMKTTKCSPGYRHKQGSKPGDEGYHECVPCVPGTITDYFGKTGSSCDKCPRGTWQPLPAQSYCRPCVNNVEAGSASCVCPNPQTLPAKCSTIECIISKLGKYFSSGCKEERSSYMQEVV